MNTNPATSQIDAAHLGHPHKVIAALGNYLLLGRCQKFICFSELRGIIEDLCKAAAQTNEEPMYLFGNACSVWTDYSIEKKTHYLQVTCSLIKK